MQPGGFWSVKTEELWLWWVLADYAVLCKLLEGLSQAQNRLFFCQTASQKRVLQPMPHGQGSCCIVSCGGNSDLGVGWL